MTELQDTGKPPLVISSQKSPLSSVTCVHRADLLDAVEPPSHGPPTGGRTHFLDGLLIGAKRCLCDIGKTTWLQSVRSGIGAHALFSM